MYLVTRQVHEGGIAAADGRLQKGDQIIAVNGTDFRTISHEGAVETLKVWRTTITTL